jgi:hypothetical protein
VQKWHHIVHVCIMCRLGASGRIIIGVIRRKLEKGDLVM